MTDADLLRIARVLFETQRWFAERHATEPCADCGSSPMDWIAGYHYRPESEREWIETEGGIRIRHICPICDEKRRGLLP